MEMEQGPGSPPSKTKRLIESFFVCLGGALLVQGVIDLGNIGQILKDRNYQYEIIFLPVTAALLSLSWYQWSKNRSGAPVFLMLGVFSGYVASFVAFYGLPLFAVHGWQRFWQPPSNSGEWVTLFWSGLIILGWLVGGLTSALVLSLSKMAPNRTVPVTITIAVIGGLLLTRRFSLLGHFIHAGR